MRFHSRIYGWEYVWKDFADEMGGQVVADESKPGSPIVALHAPVAGESSLVTFRPTVRKGRNSQAGTTVTVSYEPVDSFVFNIQSEKWLDQFGKLMGVQDFLVGDEAFDSRFLVQGNDKERVQDLFGELALRDLILMLPLEQLRVVSDKASFLRKWMVPEGHQVVVYTQEAIVDNFDHMKAIYDIFTTILGRLKGLAVPAEQYEPEESVVVSHGHLRSPLLGRG